MRGVVDQGQGRELRRDIGNPTRLILYPPVFSREIGQIECMYM